MTTDRTFQYFLKIVCVHLNIINSHDVITNFLDSDNIRHRILLQNLFEMQIKSPNDMYNTPFGLVFYKTTENYKKTFSIPIGYGVPVIQKSTDYRTKSNNEENGSIQSENEAYVVLGISDNDSVQQLSDSLDIDMMKQRNYVNSHFNPTEGVNETGLAINKKIQQFLFVTRTFTRECLNVHPLPIYDSFIESNNISNFFYVVRTNRKCTVPNVKTLAEVMQHFPDCLNIGYLQDTMLNCTLRAVPKIYAKMLSYFGHKRDIFPEDDALDTRNVDVYPGTGKTTDPVSDDNAVYSTKTEQTTEILVLNKRDYQRLRDEFSVTLHKFNGILKETAVALLSVFNLTIPDFIPEDENYIIDPAKDYILNDKLINLFKEWDVQIDGVLEILNKPRPISLGPLDEVDYWRYRSKILTAILESLKTKPSCWAINAWSILNPHLSPYTRSTDIKSLMFEAKDNSRFLLLVERHFKNLQFGPSFESVTETIPAMIQSLRLIWTISRGYNKDERMGQLLQRISWSLCDRVINVLDIRQLFKQPIQEILHEVDAAVRMLTVFETVYIQERKLVEANTQDNRWEFDKKILFGDSLYIRRILNDLTNMATCANEFYHMFGPELKNITGDSKTLKEVLRLVDQLFVPLKSQKLPFKHEFDDRASLIDARAKHFINDYFKHIKGAKLAFDLLEKFKSVKTRASVTSLLKDKYRDVLRSFSTELVKIEKTFKESKDRPGVPRYVPQVSGAIMWSRLIMNTAKTGILRFFHSQPDIFDEEEGKTVKVRYITLVEELRKYEQTLHQAWESEISSDIGPRLNQPVLSKCIDPIPFDQTFQSIFPPPTWWAGCKKNPGTVLTPPPLLSTPHASRTASKVQNQMQVLIKQLSSLHLPRNHGSIISLTSRERTSLATSATNQESLLPVYEVNFDSRLWSIIQEASRMELFGFSLPEIGRILGLRNNYYQNVVLNLQRMVDRYEAIRQGMDPLKHSLMRESLQALVTTIDRGVYYINWDSLVIDEYLEYCNQRLKCAENNVKEIDHCFTTLDRIGYIISKAKLFKEKEPGKLVSAKEYMDYAESCRDQEMEELANKVNTMATSCLRKLEEVLFNTNTGHRSEMYLIYRRFEAKIFIKLLEVVLKNMRSFVNALGGNQPLFYIDVLLVNSDVVLYPVNADLYKWMTQTLHGCTQSCRFFLRWKHGTCEPCPPLHSEGGEVITFNYVQELERCPELLKPDASLNQRAKRLNHDVVEFLKRLAYYSLLWHQDKQNVIDKWVGSKMPSTRNFENRLNHLRSLWESLDHLLGPKKLIFIGAVALRLNSFFNKVTSNLRDWIRIYASYLYESAENFYKTAERILLEKRTILDRRPTTFVEMKALLTVITDIHGGSCEYIDDLVQKVSERLRIIRLYADEEFIAGISPRMWNSTNLLNRYWNAILKSTEDVVQNMAPLKAHFSTYVVDVVKAFHKKVQAFIDKYKSSGPGNESEDLDRGYGSLIQFIEECGKLDAERQDLLNSERLLYLPISTYPELKKIQSELQKLKPIYELYLDQKTAYRDWACILWKDIEIDELINSTNEFIERLKQQSQRILGLPVALMISNSLKNFQESLVLIQYLKDDAIRDRHWKQLMEKTGISFNMDPQTFTLEDVFAMQLHEHSEVISTVVNNAQREAAIEKMWVVVQQKWMYLEAIFMGGDIAKQLPQEAKRFETIDKLFRKIMQQTQNSQFIFKCCLTEYKLDPLKSLSHDLEFCQKALNDYLDLKRNAFPRFYFISDDEMLGILGSKEPEIIQEHIVKMFDNIGKIKFTHSLHSSDISASALISFEGETMIFNKPVFLVGKVEEWLTSMENEMQHTNRLLTKKAIFYYCNQKSRVAWMFDYQGMVVLAASQIWFTWEVEDVFQSFKQGYQMAMKDFNKKLEFQLNEIIYQIRNDLTPNDMKKLETVLIIDVHAKHIVEKFIRDSIMVPDDFAWESQLRFYWVCKSDELIIRQCSAEFEYGYEYFGLNGRLVITPLTDRIYLTLTQALSLCLGGAASGSTGTGKTETVKDLAKALGYLCIVTNCGENMDCKVIYKDYSTIN
ncbi:unnamed protein product [Heterobilharzia americana]|nr:unnamed protein product [Heterobilharzia americana]